jgi:hypothetical protein
MVAFLLMVIMMMIVVVMVVSGSLFASLPGSHVHLLNFLALHHRIVFTRADERVERYHLHATVVTEQTSNGELSDLSQLACKLRIETQDLKKPYIYLR